LDEFINITGNDILKNAGAISHEKALEKANEEYEKYLNKTKNDLSEAEKHFIKHLEESNKKIEGKS
jgi:hypothetical protein